MTDGERQRYHVIDLFRFAAAAAVMLYHYTATSTGNTLNDRPEIVGPRDLFAALEPVTRFGWIGVELFFMISGFVILASALGRTPVEFAISRFTRLYPTFWAGVAFTTLALALFLGSSFDVTTWDVVANATMLPGYLRVPLLDPVYWTLGVELQFYAWILLFLVLGIAGRPRIWLSAWLGIAVLRMLTGFPDKMPLFITAEYASLFIAGAVFYLGTREGFKRIDVALIVACWLVSVRFAFPHAALYIGDETRADQIVAAGIITVFFLMFAAVATGRLSIRASTIVATLGGLTFPLYLVHHEFGRYLIDRLHPGLPPAAILLVATVLSLGVAWIIYQSVDRRLAPWMRRSLTRRLVRRA